MMTPEEFIQLPENKIKEIFESGRGLDNISHIVRIKKAREIGPKKIFKRSLIVLKEFRNVITEASGIETFDLYLTYRKHGLWLTITKNEEETKVIMMKKYEWGNNGWEEIEDDTSGINKREDRERTSRNNRGD